MDVIEQSEKEQKQEASRRAQVRLRLLEGSRAFIRIVKVEGDEVRMPPGFADLTDLSPGGCSFRSGLRLPVHSGILYRFEWQGMDEKLALNGQLRWRAKDENGYRYGMRFLPDIREHRLLIGLLNRLVLRTCPDQERIHRIYQANIGYYRSFERKKEKL